MNGPEKEFKVVVLRLFPNAGSSRGGEFRGERREYEARWVVGVSSSKGRFKVELSVDRPGDAPTVTGLDELAIEVVLFVGEITGNRTVVTDGVRLVEADADMADACGSLGPLRNGLNNHDGANLELREARKEPVLPVRPFVAFEDAVDDDLVERIERTEDWDGDVLKLLRETPSKTVEVEGSSGGRSLIIWRGLSSIGGILEDRIDLVEMEFRCEIKERLSNVDRYDEAMMVPLPDDVKEFRFAPEDLNSGFSAKMSKSNLSASRFRLEDSFWFVIPSRKRMVCGSVLSGKNGTSMLERTSCSSKPNI